MSTKFYSFPHWEINVKDESMPSPLVVEQLALHRPIFFTLGERGPIGKPVYGSYAEHSKIFGAGTFDVFSKFYRHPTLFIERALRYQKSFVVRLADEDAKSASLILECSVYNKSLIQYQKDLDGYRLKDVDGNYIPVDDNGSPLKEMGTVVKWKIRALAVNENPATIVPSTSVIPDPDGGANLEVTTYPVAVFIASSPGAWANSTAFRLSWNPESNHSAASNMGALIYTFGMVEIPWGFDTTQPIRTKFMDTVTEFTFKPDTTDRATMRRYSLDEVIRNDYNSESVNFSLRLFPEYVEAIGNRCLEYESVVDFPELTTPYMVNTFTGKTFDSRHYDHIYLDIDSDDAVLLDANVSNYMSGGDDGDTSDATLEYLTREWLTGNVFPDIKDQARFPITHLYDSGYEATTKEALINFLGIRDDVKIILSTQSAYEEPNTKAEDQSMGSYLRGRTLLHPESFIYGTQACRVTILQQCGRLTELTPYVKYVPTTLDCLTKKGKFQGALYIKGKPKGLPESAVTILKDFNWVPVDADFKQLSWDNAINYLQHYDMTGVHYPDVISVYPYLTSLLSDDIFTDMLVYIKHIIRFQWAKFAGIDDPIAVQIANIKDSIGRDIYSKLGNSVRAEVNPYQTDLDAELGSALTIEVPVYGTMSNRVWNVIVPVRRELV